MKTVFRDGDDGYEHEYDRPETRGECKTAPRPCPWVSCKYHLYLDPSAVSENIKFNFPWLEPWEIKETCSLDVADRGGSTLEQVGKIIHLTRERIRQLEIKSFASLREEPLIKE